MTTKKWSNNLHKFHFTYDFLVVHDQTTQKVFVYGTRPTSHTPNLVKKGQFAYGAVFPYFCNRMVFSTAGIKSRLLLRYQIHTDGWRGHNRRRCRPFLRSFSCCRSRRTDNIVTGKYGSFRCLYYRAWFFTMTSWDGWQRNWY